MSTQATIKRYYLLTGKVGSSQFPTFEEIKTYLHDQGFEISPRTLQRDIEQVRNEFGVEIKYDRLKKGYFVDKELSVEFDTFIRFLEITINANVIADCLRDGKNNLKYLDFEANGNLKGIENLEPIFKAVKNQKVISFRHENYQTGKTSNYVFSPYFLKEYNNRWYVIGKLEGKIEFRTIGLDRIIDLIVMTKSFKKDKKENPPELFDDTIGITFGLNETEEVLLAFTPLEAKYVKSLPWHKSQRIISENEKEVIVRLFVSPNYELNQLILKMGDQVKVLKPLWLAKEIQQHLKKAINRYK